jgi:hypothetical protein
MKRILKNVVSLLRRSGKRSMLLTRPALELLEDRCVPSTFTVTNVKDSGPGSLRQAILDANQHFLANHTPLQRLTGAAADVPADVIQFKIGSGVKQITTLSPLPPLADDVVIDGTTQPGYHYGKPLIVLSGTPADGGAIGLDFVEPPSGRSISESGVRGLVINHFGTAIQVPAGGDWIAQCYIGTEVSGSVAAPNDIGIAVVPGVAGKTSIWSNVISGNYADGIFAFQADETDIENNWIGTNAAATRVLGNGGAGVHLQASNGNYVAYNVIGGNYDGVRVESSWQNIIRFNWIGTNYAGARLGNSHDGVLLQSHPWDSHTYSGNVVGANLAWLLLPNQQVPSTAGDGNVIAYNLHDGVHVEGVRMIDNPIAGNSIYGNGHLGIDLGLPPSVAPLLWIAQSGKTTVVEGLVAGATPYATYYVEFYASPAGSRSSAQGQRYLGSTAMMWNPFSGVPIFVATLGKTTKGEIITATVTDAAGNTTEFSAGLSAR